MGRPLLRSTLHSASCHCQSCVSPASAPPEPESSASSTPQHQPSLSPTPSLSFADRVRDLRNHTLQAEASISQSISDSQQSLQRASSAIEAAYERLLALRLRLRHSLDTMSSGTNHRSSSTSAMGPEHAAIVLSGHPAASQPTLAAGGLNSSDDPMLSSDVSNSVNRTEGHSVTSIINRRFTELAGEIEEPRVRPYLFNVPSSRRHASIPSGPRSPTESPSTLTAGRMIPPLYARRDSSANEASTSLGRRVEARANAARTTTGEDLRSDLREFMEAADASLTLLARQSQQLLVSSRDFRQDPASPAFDPPNSGSWAQSTGDASLRRWFARDRAALWRQNMRDRRPRDPEGTTGVVISLRGMQGDRASDASSTVSASYSARPRSDSLASMPDLEDDETEDPANRRSYRLRRRLNPGAGSDQIVRVSNSVEDDRDGEGTSSGRRRQSQVAGLSPARIWPETSVQDGETATFSTGEAPTNNLANEVRSYFLWPPSEIPRRRIPITTASGRRRRGWARLDPDGNEIPTDDEEEYERNRTHMRVRAQALTSRQPGRHPAVERVSVEATTLPPAPLFASDDWTYPDPAFHPPLVLGNPITDRGGSPMFRPRLNSHDSNSSAASTITANCDSAEQDVTDIPTPGFQPSPLPWTSLDFLSGSRSRHTQKWTTTSMRRVRSSMWSPFAGR